MADVQSGRVRVQPTDETKNEVRTALGLEPEPVRPADERRTFHVHDRRVEVSQWVMREILRNALGESFTYELVPMAVPAGAGGMNVGYMLSVATRSGLVGSDHDWLNVTSKPFDYMMPEAGVQEITRACVAELRKARARMLSER